MRAMEYEVAHIPSTSLFRDKSVVKSAEQIAIEIRARYEYAQRWGGRVIAHHTLTCTPERQTVGRSRFIPKGDPSDCLFLVMELPDGYMEREKAEVRARQAASTESPTAPPQHSD
jgi:hypothetical protein